MTTKEAILELIRRLPESVTVEDVLATLVFHQKVEGGLSELVQGQGVPHRDARERIKKWLS